MLEGSVVTVAVSNIAFLQPVQAGDAVCCYTDPVRIGRTSITLNIEVWVLRQGRGARLKVTEAEFTFGGERERPPLPFRIASPRGSSYRISAEPC